jgi:hypothetical protein
MCDKFKDDRRAVSRPQQVLRMVDGNNANCLPDRLCRSDIYIYSKLQLHIEKKRNPDENVLHSAAWPDNFVALSYCGTRSKLVLRTSSPLKQYHQIIIHRWRKNHAPRGGISVRCTITIPLRTAARGTCLSASATVCPATAVVTSARLRCMVLTTVGA